MSAPPGLTLYSIGDPSDEEQLYLEDINRARRDPKAEGQLLALSTDPDVLRNYKAFSVDLELMAADMAALPATPPLSMNAQLTVAARAHSQDMLAKQFQGHDSSDGTSFDKRITAAGYNFHFVGENVFAHAHSVLEGHAGFEVDWGGDASTGGMQDPPHHRLNIHDAQFREVGIGIALGTNGDYGPQSVTQDFGTVQNDTPFVTGVVYYDFNGNGSYDLGEGLGGAMIAVTGSSFYAVSANAGGYSVPVSGDGSYPVRFSVTGLPDHQVTAAVSGGSNVKVDWVLPYNPPVLSGSEKPAVGFSNPYSFSAVPGATAYQWKSGTLKPASGVDGAENGFTFVTANTSAGYAAIDSTVVASGNHSFHLAHPGSSNAPPVDQFLTLATTYRAEANMQLTFASRLGWSSPQETARAQASVDGGQTWQDVWSQSGTGGIGEEAFSSRSVMLGQFAGKEVMLRFAYTVAGSFFPQTDPGVGWYLDNIGVQGANILSDEAVADVTGGSTSFSWTPAQAGTVSLSVRAKVSGRFLPWGPEKQVTAQIGPPPPSNLTIARMQKLADGRMQIDFTVTNPGTATFSVQSALNPAGAWNPEVTATVQTLPGGAGYRGLIARDSASARFFRIVAN